MTRNYAKLVLPYLEHYCSGKVVEYYDCGWLRGNKRGHWLDIHPITFSTGADGGYLRMKDEINPNTKYPYFKKILDKYRVQIKIVRDFSEGKNIEVLINNEWVSREDIGFFNSKNESYRLNENGIITYYK